MAPPETVPLIWTSWPDAGNPDDGVTVTVSAAAGAASTANTLITAEATATVATKPGTSLRIGVPCFPSVAARGAAAAARSRCP